jgi:serine/threonine-protein kinase ULK/ATG1
MRQIIDAFRYIHSKNIMHRDIKLENILIHFDNPQDKENLNMMKAKIKIIDFGFARKIDKNTLATTTIGNPINMSPLLLRKLTSQGKLRQLGYDQKADIWSLGAICYQMLIGKCAFDADDMDDLVNKIEEGKYKVPTSLSTEVVSFLNGMLQYEPKQRLTSEELYNHQFLRNNVKDFHKLDLTQVSDKVKDGKLVMETKKEKNRTIWSVFNENDKLLKISPGRLANTPENSGQVQIKHKNTLDFGNSSSSNNNIINNPPIKSSNTFQMYSHPNINNNNNYRPNYNNPYSGPILPRGNQGVPGYQVYQNPSNYSNLPQNSNIPNYSNPSNYSSPPMMETDYSFRGGIYGNLEK